MDTESTPEWARWIAMDQNGAWWCYEAEPHLHDTGWYENEVGRSIKIKNPIDNDLDWKNSLTKI